LKDDSDSDDEDNKPLIFEETKVKEVMLKKTVVKHKGTAYFAEW
jgi:hypothetical protein